MTSNGAKALIIAGGLVDARSIAYEIKTTNFTHIYFADDGALKLNKLEFEAKSIRTAIGDFDSCLWSELRVLEHKAVYHFYPREKNLTDTELILTKIKQEKFAEITLMISKGDMNARLDHLLGQVMLLKEYSHLPLKINCDGEIVYYIQGTRRLSFKRAEGIRFSIVALNKGTKLSLSGCLYKLDEEVLGNGTKGLSNEIKGSRGLRLNPHGGEYLLIFSQ